MTTDQRQRSSAKDRPTGHRPRVAVLAVALVAGLLAMAGLEPGRTLHRHAGSGDAVVHAHLHAGAHRHKEGHAPPVATPVEQVAEGWVAPGQTPRRHPRGKQSPTGRRGEWGGAPAGHFSAAHEASHRHLPGHGHVHEHRDGPAQLPAASPQPTSPQPTDGSASPRTSPTAGAGDAPASDQLAQAPPSASPPIDAQPEEDPGEDDESYVAFPSATPLGSPAELALVADHVLVSPSLPALPLSPRLAAPFSPSSPRAPPA